jgi:hypothetical protein
VAVAGAVATPRPGRSAPASPPLVTRVELAAAATWLAVVVVAEVLFLLAGLVVGLIAAVVALAWLLVIGLVRPGAIDGRAALALAVIPLLRVLSIALPSVLVPTWIWYAEIGAGVVIATLIAARALRLAPADLGLRPAPAFEAFIAVAIGLVVGLALTMIAGTASVLPDRSPISLVLASIVVVGGGAISEEILLRGLIQRVAEDVVGSGAVMVSTGLTTLLYLGTMNVQYVAVMTLFAYAYGSVTRRTGSLLPAITCHAALLWSQLVLWPAVVG